jgi:Ni/Co efflux regulator RcnB
MKIPTLAAAALLAVGLAAAPAMAQPPQGDRHGDQGDRHGDNGDRHGDRGDRHDMRGGDHGMRGDRHDMRGHHGWNRGHHYGWRNGRGHHCRVIYRHHHRTRICR